MKNSFLIFAFLLPLLSFGRDFAFCRVRVYSFSTPGATNVSYQGYSSVSDSAGLRAVFYNSTFGILVQTSLNSVISPSVGNQQIGYSSLFNKQISTNGNNFVLSPLLFPEVEPIYSGVLLLLRSGYSGTGVTEYFRSSSYVGYNVNFPTLVSDVLASTNTVYRQIVISSLSSLEDSVDNIRVDLGQFQSDYQDVNFERLNFFGFLDGLSQSEGLDASYVQHVKDTYNGFISIGDTSSASAFKSAVLGKLNDDSRLFDYSQWLKENPHAFDGFGKSFGDALASGGSYHFTTPMTNELRRLSTNVVAEVHSALFDNTAQITNQLSHMFDDNPNSVGRAIRSTANNTASAAQGVSAISSKLDSLHVQIDNPNNIGVVLDGPVTIDTTQFNGVSVPLTGLKDKIDTWYNDWYSFWDISTPVYSWDNFYNMIRDFKDQNHSDIASITNLPFFSAVSNSLASIDKFLQTNSFSSSLHALLLDDYADYITNRFYSSAVDTFKDDYPSVYTNLVKFGLSTVDGEGNFWSLFSSTLFYQSALVCGMLEDLATVRQFADDHIDGGFSGGVTSLIEKMPSSTELADSVNMASNEVLKIEAAANSFYTAYSAMTNSAVSAFSPFRGIFSSVPENVVFFKTGNEQYITIPVSQGGNAWSVIRLCFSFSLVAVNVILFPKFVLMVIVLLSKLSKRFVKFVPTDR